MIYDGIKMRGKQGPKYKINRIDTMGIRCQVNKEQNTQKNDKIQWE